MALTCLECDRVIEGTYAVLLFLGHTKVTFVEPKKARIRLVLCDGHGLGTHAEPFTVFKQPEADMLGFALAPAGVAGAQYTKTDILSMIGACRVREAEYVSEQYTHLFIRSVDRLRHFLDARAKAFPEFKAGIDRFFGHRAQVGMSSTKFAPARSGGTSPLC